MSSKFFTNRTRQNSIFEKLKTIFANPVKEPLKLKNSKNATIFHFIFASNNEKATKVAQYIIRKKKS